MDIGDVLLRTGLLATLASGALAIPGLRGRKVPAAAGWLYGLQTAVLVGSLALLAHHFLAHHFEYRYVAQNSSRALSPALTLAALWAGQQGSILLWAALASLLGLALIRQPGSLSMPSLVFVNLSQLFFYFLLMVASPFAKSATVPADGMGLNPLLEDPWMVAHPPVLFLGYAAMVMPFALAGAALIRGEYREWNKQVWPWALFAVVSLGTGIVLGGVWAYKVLGWGGYWGWDPVENASLVPWLLAVAMLHGLLIQRTLGAMTRTNLLLAVLGWITVVGGTYLTRSGVLADFSVHSFADDGLGPILTATLLGTIFVGGLLLAWRWTAIEPKRVEWVSVSRESGLFLGLMTVLVLAVLVTAGTTMPLLTGLAGRPATVSAKFYEGVILPMALAILLLMALAPALRWTRQQGNSWLTLLPPGLFAGLVAAGGMAIYGKRDPLWMVLMFATGLALGVNAWVAARLFRRGWSYGAGYLGHAGIAVMAVGMVISSAFGQSEKVAIRQGETRQVLGYQVTFTGERHEPRDVRVLEVRVEKGTWSMQARPRLMPSPRGEGVMRTPALDLWRDVYVSPIDVERDAYHAGTEPLWLEQGRETVVGDVGYTFKGFRMEHSGEAVLAIADLEARIGSQVFALAPALRSNRDGTKPVPVEVPGVGVLMLANMDADHARVGVIPPGAATVPTAILDFSTKPMVNLVWVGALLTLVGTALAGLRRAAEQTTRTRAAEPAPMKPRTA